MNTGKSLPIRSLPIRPLAVAAATALAVCLAAAGHAAPLALTDVPVDRAAAQLGALYGVDIRLQRHSARRITLTVEDPGAADGRLAAVNALANAAGLDFTKCYVVGRASGGRAVPPAVDSSAPLPLGAGAHPAREVIALLAGVDDATAQVAGDVAGTVTLPAASLTVGAAAAEVARQTGTSWRTVYVLAGRGQGPAGTALGGAITQLAYVYSVDPEKEAETQRAVQADQRQEDQERQAQEAATQRMVGQQAAAYQQAMAQRGAAGGPLTNGGYYGGAYPSNFPAFPYAATGAYGPANGPANGTFTISGMAY